MGLAGFHRRAVRGHNQRGALAGAELLGADMGTDGDTINAARELLAEAALIISSFQRRVQDAGYPFPLPPGTRTILNRIDGFMHPEESGRLRKQILSKTGA